MTYQVSLTPDIKNHGVLILVPESNFFQELPLWAVMAILFSFASRVKAKKKEFCPCEITNFIFNPYRTNVENRVSS